VWNSDDNVSGDEGSVGDKYYAQSEHIPNVNSNDSDQNESANDVSACPTHMALVAGRPIFPV
jgi:hypothetical protein